MLNLYIPHNIKHMLHFMFYEWSASNLPATTMKVLQHTFRFSFLHRSTAQRYDEWGCCYGVLNSADYVHTSTHIAMLRHYNIPQAHTPSLHLETETECSVCIVYGVCVHTHIASGDNLGDWAICRQTECIHYTFTNYEIESLN